MRWQPSDALTSGAATISGDKLTLTLAPAATRVECLWDSIPLGGGFACEFEVRALTAPSGVPLILWQLHTAADALSLNPIAALECTDGQALIVWRHHVGAPVAKASAVIGRMPAGGAVARWSVEGRHDLVNGSLRVRRNGVLVLDYAGPLGYAVQQPAYQKRGVYSWVPRAQPVVVEASA